MERDKLIIENQNLIYHALKKMKKYDRHEELFDIGMIGLIKGVDTYKEDKGVKLSTYLYRCIFNEILQWVRRENAKCRKGITISLDEEIIDDSGNKTTLSNIFPSNYNLEKEICKDDILQALEEEFKTLNEVEKKVLDYTYGLHNREELNQNKIMKETGYSQPHISRIKKRALKKLKARLREYV